MNTECEKYETYTLKIDTKFGTSNTSFISYLNIPLRNVVKVEVLSVSVASNTLTTPAIYLYIMELETKFNDRPQLQTAITSFGSSGSPMSNIGPTLSGTFSNVNQLQTALVCIPTEQVNPRTVFTSGGYYPVVTEFIEPIRQIQQLTISMYKDNGDLLTTTGTTFITLKFTCAKPNRCLY
jgi:hypothetical protein